MAFQAQTNWCVITGAPSSGKTSVIDVLARRGFETQVEVARELIELGLRQGQTLDQIRGNSADLQRHILSLALAREKALDPAALIFLDRGLPDSITYCRLARMDTGPAEEAARHFGYRAVFIFDRLPVVKDAVRTEDEALAAKIDRMLDRDYAAVGYRPLRVPVLSIEERADFILKHLEL